MGDTARRAFIVLGCVTVWLGAYRRVGMAPRFVDNAEIPTHAVGIVTDLGVIAPERNPFRVDGRFVQESPVPDRDDGSGAERPHLRLLAIVGGPPWRALLAGVPGSNGGIVVDEGRRIGDLHVRRVRADSVWVAGFDTLWTLSLPARP